MRIYIPSAGRASPENIGNGPLMDIPRESRPTVTYVVPYADIDDYFGTFENMGLLYDGVNLLGHDLVGISPVRAYIGAFESERDGDGKFMMLDDDIRFVRRIADDTLKLRKMAPEEWDTMIDFTAELLDDFGHVGISPRQGNNRMGTGSMRDVVVRNTRTIRALAYRVKDFMKVQHDRIPVMEDFDTNLQLLRMGIPNANIGYFSQDQKQTNAAGGCSEWRTHEVHEKAAMKLQEMHPDFVKLRQKQNKTDRDGFGTRTEVTIQWKKAFKSHELIAPRM